MNDIILHDDVSTNNIRHSPFPAIMTLTCDRSISTTYRAINILHGGGAPGRSPISFLSFTHSPLPSLSFFSFLSLLSSSFSSPLSCSSSALHFTRLRNKKNLQQSTVVQYCLRCNISTSHLPSLSVLHPALPLYLPQKCPPLKLKPRLQLGGLRERCRLTQRSSVVAHSV